MTRAKTVEVAKAFEDFCVKHGIQKRYSYDEGGLNFVVTLTGRLDLDGGVSITDVEKPVTKRRPGRPRTKKK